MDKLVFRAALRASAKVALTATIASCGGAIQASSSGDSSDAATREPVAEAGGETALADAPPDGQACEPPAAASLLPRAQHPGAVVPDGTFACCLDVLGPLLRTDAQIATLSDAAAGDPLVVDCCAAVVVRVDDDYSDFDAGARDRAELADAGLGPQWGPLEPCCAPLGYPEGPTCTPWGPPMPPVMPGVA